jgi:ribosomal protein S27E
MPLCTWGGTSIYASIEGRLPSFLRVACLDCRDHYVY